MKQCLTIFHFEFMNYAKNKVFLIVTLLLVAVVGVVLSIPRIQASASPEGGKAPAEKQVVAVADRTGGNADTAATFLASAAPDTEFRATARTEADLKRDVDTGIFDSAVVLTSPLSYRHIVKNIGLYDSLSAQLNEAVLAKYRQETLSRLGVPAAEIRTVLSAQVQSETVQTGSGKDQMKNFFYTYILIFALYMAILLYGQFVATSVATEKSSRAMELLITSARPTNLIFGKVLGAGAAGLAQFILIFGSSYLFYNLNRDFFRDVPIIQSIFNMPLNILLYVLLFFLLGFFLYAFLYGALASLVSRMEELSSMILPVTMLFIVAFFIVMFSMGSGNVDSALMRAASFIPFTSPMAMFVRIAMGEVAGWEVAVSVAVLVASTIGAGFLAALIYRMGVLLYGKTPKPGEIIRMLKGR